MNVKRELDDLHFQLASLYRRGSEDAGLIADYWTEIGLVESEHGDVGGWIRWKV